MVWSGADTMVGEVMSAGLAGLGDNELLALSRSIELSRRGVEAQQVRVLAEIETAGVAHH